MVMTAVAAETAATGIAVKDIAVKDTTESADADAINIGHCA